MLVEGLVPSGSFLEYAFLKWVLGPIATPGLLPHIVPQAPVDTGTHVYRVDYGFVGSTFRLAIELDGFEFHGTRSAFTYDRLRQNDLTAAGWRILRFSYDAIRLDTARCVEKLRAILALDPIMGAALAQGCVVEPPEMPVGHLHAVDPSPAGPVADKPFDRLRAALDLTPLRRC
jgi:hypothetical protein